MCTSILSGRSYVIEVLEGNPRVCYDIFRMDKTIFRHLCNELKRLHLLEEDTGWVSVEESVGTVLFIVGHNADYRLTANSFQHSLETIQRRFWRALRAIHALGCIIIWPNVDAAELPHSLWGNEKYYPWFEVCIDFFIFYFVAVYILVMKCNWERLFVMENRKKTIWSMNIFCEVFLLFIIWLTTTTYFLLEMCGGYRWDAHKCFCPIR